MLMLLLAVFGLQAGMARSIPAWLHTPFGLPLDIFSWLIILCYLASTIILYRLDRRAQKGELGHHPAKSVPFSFALTVLASLAAAAVIVGAGIWLACIGEDIAGEYGIARSFVGTLFFAAVAGVRRRTGRLLWRISWVSLIILACYIAGLVSTYLS